MSTVPVTTWYLEQTSPADLAPAGGSAPIADRTPAAGPAPAGAPGRRGAAPEPDARGQDARGQEARGQDTERHGPQRPPAPQPQDPRQPGPQRQDIQPQDIQPQGQQPPGPQPQDAPPEDGSGVRIVRAEVPSPEFSRFLYTAVGGDVTWTDRLDWPYARWREFLDRPGVETWVAYDRGTPAGFIELDAQDGGVVEISYFGLLPAFRGRGIGGLLLTAGTARAWDLAERWPGREPTRRVWVHTCSKDGPYALDNYRRRGFRVFDTRTEDEPDTAPPGPWPGAGDQR